MIFNYRATTIKLIFVLWYESYFLENLWFVRANFSVACDRSLLGRVRVRSYGLMLPGLGVGR